MRMTIHQVETAKRTRAKNYQALKRADRVVLEPEKAHLILERIARRTDGTEWESPHKDPVGPSHYSCTIVFGGRDLSCEYSCDSAHLEPPTVCDVLQSLVWDASYADEPFESWCEYGGHDTDSRKAERIYKACVAIRFGLRDLFGQELFDRLQEELAEDEETFGEDIMGETVRRAS